MATLFLSGAGGSSNWLPLILPIAALLVILLSVDFVIRLIRRKRNAPTNANRHIEDESF